MRHILVCPRAEGARLRSEHPTLEVLEDDEPGVYAAINRGLRVEGAWDTWTWLNDDDRWNAAGIARGIERLDTRPEIALAYGKVRYISESGQPLGFLPIASHPGWLRPLHARGIAALSQQGTLVRRSALEMLGPLDTRFRLAADFSWWHRALEAGLCAGFVDEHVADFRVQRGQLSQHRAEMLGEIRSVVAAHGRGVSAIRGGGYAVLFRLVRLREIVARWRATGCWRTSSLLRKYGGGGV